MSNRRFTVQPFTFLLLITTTILYVIETTIRTSKHFATNSVDNFIREKMAMPFLYPATDKHTQDVGEELYFTREAAMTDDSSYWHKISICY